jgi:hypothetical protein
VSIESAATRVILSCRAADGHPRYDLPAFPAGWRTPYHLYWRPQPTTVIHHGKGIRFELPEREFVLVGTGVHHCISLSVDAAGLPTSAYVNINLEPEQRETGWAWRDLELDWKLRVDHRSCWSAILLDLDEFEAARLSRDRRDLAISEALRVLDLVRDQAFPFDLPLRPYLGLDPRSLPAMYAAGTSEP